MATSLPVYFLCEVEPLGSDRPSAAVRCPDCGKSDRVVKGDHGFSRCSRCRATFETDWELKRKRRAALGGDAGGRRATVPAVPRLVRAARAEGENLHWLRGVLDTAFPEIGGPVRAATHPALPSFPATFETSAC